MTNNLKKLGNTLKKHSPEIMIGAGIVGFVSTVVLVAKEAPLVKEQLDDLYQDLAEREELTKTDIVLEELKVAVPIYAPAMVTGTLSIVCVLGGYKMVSKKSAAFAAAYELAHKELSTYQNKVKELYGEKKEEKVHHEIHKDELENNPPSKELYSEEIITDGQTLFYDRESGRYFRSTVDKVRKAEKRVSDRLPVESWVSLNEFYWELGLPNITLGDDVGFNVGEGIDIDFDSHVAPGDTPCLVLVYRTLPRYDYSCKYGF